MRDQRGTHVAGSEPEALEQAADLRFLSRGGQDLNLRPTDYEFDACSLPAVGRSVHVRHLGAGFGDVDREPPQNELEELAELMDLAFASPDAPP